MLVAVKRLRGATERIVFRDEAERRAFAPAGNSRWQRTRSRGPHPGLDSEAVMAEHLGECVDGLELLPADLRILPIQSLSRIMSPRQSSSTRSSTRSRCIFFATIASAMRVGCSRVCKRSISVSTGAQPPARWA